MTTKNTAKITALRAAAEMHDDAEMVALAGDVADAYGYTFPEWLAEAGRRDSASEYDLRAAWRAGEPPSDYAIGSSADA